MPCRGLLWQQNNLRWQPFSVLAARSTKGLLNHVTPGAWVSSCQTKYEKPWQLVVANCLCVHGLCMLGVWGINSWNLSASMSAAMQVINTVSPTTDDCLPAAPNGWAHRVLSPSWGGLQRHYPTHSVTKRAITSESLLKGEISWMYSYDFKLWNETTCHLNMGFN